MVHDMIISIVEEGIIIVESAGVVNIKSIVVIEGVVIHGYVYCIPWWSVQQCLSHFPPLLGHPKYQHPLHQASYQYLLWTS